MCLWAGAGCGTAGPRFGGPPPVRQSRSAPSFLTWQQITKSLAASVGCEDAPPRSTRLRWEKLGQFSKLSLHAVGFRGKGRSEASSLTPGHGALLFPWLPGPHFRAEKLLCATWPQLCHSSAKRHQTGVCLVVSVLWAHEAEQDGGGGKAGVSHGGPVHRQFCAGSNLG